jgi:hypothetical protein
MCPPDTLEIFGCCGYVHTLNEHLKKPNGWEWWGITPKPKIIEINQALGDTTKLK